MKINRIGLNYTHSQNFAINRPTGSGDYLLLLVKSPAKLMIHGNEVIAEKNSIIVFNKGTPQLYSAYNGTYTNDFIHFDAEGERELRNFPFDTLLPLPSIKQVNRILRDIYLEFISNNANREESMDLLMRLLFVKINEVVAYKPTNTVLYDYYDALLNLRSMIYRHPEEKWTITSLAQQVNLSTSHFQRLYKNTFGVSCIADVIACKMEYAKASLSATGGTVREIAALCGYENEEHFMRQFKREVGITPTQYRKKLRDIN
ncbi:MAG TPA: AraC family transcriptional regulator [Mobilitalea sp.]|nr:AraC family transcriptional regulator [Mobilitalea sp.]